MPNKFNEALCMAEGMAGQQSHLLMRAHHCHSDADADASCVNLLAHNLVLN
jgi:hypothetical protein